MVEFKIIDKEKGKTYEFSYETNELGTIKLKSISEDLKILTFQFEELTPIQSEVSLSEADELLDDDISIMLANYPCELNNLNELKGKVLNILEGWTDDMPYTMVTFRDGESINHNRISFDIDENGLFDIHWEGQYSKWQTDYSDRYISLKLKARVDENFVTPLCENDNVLLEKLSK